jgi:hypothetical protein
MGTVPTPRSYQQILSDLVDGFRSKVGVRNLRVGGGILSMLEATARSDLRSSQDTFGVLNSTSLDNSTGIALDRKGADEQCPRLLQAASSGSVTIADSSFTKKSTKLFQGAPAPIVGSVVIAVVDATSFPSTGSIYIGRGTQSYEGPIAYSSKANVGTHWTLTLSTGTTVFHNTTETVVLAQGGARTIGPGTVCQTPQANVADAVQFRTLYKATVLDGETSVTGVTVVAQLKGTVGNVLAGSISGFVQPPFTGATITNPLPFSNGVDTELDDPYRERIRAAAESRQAGTTLALTNSVLGITSADENKRVSSSNIIRRKDTSALYVDDGTGYEEQTAPVAIEVLVDSAAGGEQDISISQRPIAKAFCITQNSAPYALTAGAVLSVNVAGTTSVHVFGASDFASIGNASAYEVVASINSNPQLTFQARTSAGTQVVLFAKADTNEDIEVVASEGTDANTALLFPLNVVHTVQLYKNDRLMTKDGSVASVSGLAFSEWNTMTGNQTLILSVDGTPSATFTFSGQSFIDSRTGFASVGRNSVDAWVSVINAAIPGVTASNGGGRIVLTSNSGASGKAAVSILNGSTMVANKMFSVVSAQGAAPDFVLNRNASQITLTTALVAGDRLSLGSLNTRAFAQSAVIPPTTLSSVAKLWFVVDGDAQVVTTGINAATTISVTVFAMHDWGHTLQLFASAGTPFNNVQAGDWLILWDPALNATLQGAFRVVSASGNKLIVERRLGSALRVGHRSVALPGSGATIGKVLTTGGGTSPLSSTSATPAGVTSACEIYDPNTSLSAPCAPMSFTRAFHTATVLQDGTVLVTGGIDDSGTRLTSMEVYNPTSNTWITKASVLPVAVTKHQATVLADGTVLITGGNTGSGATDAFIVYNPGTDTIVTTGTLVAARYSHKQVLLPSTNVLIVGGSNGSDLATIEIWHNGTMTSVAGTSMARARSSFGLALVGTSPTTVLAAGNRFGATGKGTYEIYTIGTGLWGSETALPGAMNFEDNDLVSLPNGNVVGLNGTSSDLSTSVGFQYDGATFTNTALDGNTAESSGRWLAQFVPISNGSATIKNRVIVVGGVTQLSTAWGFLPTATVEQYDNTGDSWSLPDPALTSSVTLTGAGAAVVRTAGLVRQVSVPIATNYTASTFAAVVNADATNPGVSGLALPPALIGATATIYQTNRVRITTNTHAPYGDIALVAQNPAAAGFGLSPASAADNLTDHVGSVESKSELGTPAFNDINVRANTSGGSLIIGASAVDVAYSLVGLHNWWRGSNGSSTYSPTFFYPRAGSNAGFRTRLTGTQAYTDLSRIDLRDTSVEPWTPLDRAYLAAPFAIGPSDDLTVTVNNDVSKRFPIKMWRTLAPVGNTYQQTNTFTDADASTGLQNTFGSTYDFNDFTVYMNSRAVAFSSDSTKSLLFRFYRLGPDGDTARVRFGNPVTPSTPLSVTTTMAADKTDATVVLASGAPRSITVRSTTSLGQAVNSVDGGGIATIFQVLNLAIGLASRTSNVDTLTLNLPGSVTDHGLQIGNVVWVQSTDVNFSTGAKTITGRTATTITYAETAADAGPDANIGNLSFDSAGLATFSGGGTAATDWFRFNGGAGSLSNTTFQISAVGSGGGLISTKSGDQASTLTPTTTLAWTNVGVPANVLVMQNTPQTATAVVAAINALAAAPNSTCPITAAVLGSGSGNIVKNSPDDLDVAGFWYALADGINWVSTTILPGSNYQLTFKKPITGTLSANAAWQNEVVHIAPSTAKNVVNWLNTPTVTGLFTACSIQASDDGTKVQIASLTPGSAGGVQVQGGLADSVAVPLVGTTRDLVSKSASTIKTSDATGIAKGFWCRVANSTPLPITNNFSAGLSITSWNSAGLITFSGAVIAPIVTPTQAKVRIERQGDFVFVTDMGMAQNIFLSSAQAGAWVRITPAVSPTGGFPQVSSANQGIYRVLRTANVETGASGGIFIENLNSVDEIAECEIALYVANSVMPGDTFVLSTPIWGAANQGTWTVKAAGETSAGSGDQFAHLDRFTVDVSQRTPAPQGSGPALTSTTAGLVYLIENAPASFIFKVDGIAPNQADGSYTDIRWDSLPFYSGIGEGAGSIVSVLDKLNFPGTFASGTDGYRYSTGLIGEANKVIYGDPADPTTYPGIAAEGANVDIAGPLIKRIAVSLLLRIRSGVSQDGIADRVRSAVATVINQTPIGQSIPLSSIVAAASKVVGVLAVTIVSPSYGVGRDSISVNANEKPLVLSLTTDIGVTFLGT